VSVVMKQVGVGLCTKYACSCVSSISLWSSKSVLVPVVRQKCACSCGQTSMLLWVNHAQPCCEHVIVDNNSE